MISVVDLVVDTDGFGVLLGVGETESKPVGGHERVVALRGQRGHAVQVLGERAFAADGKLVPGEWLVRPGFEAVVQRKAAALPIDQAAEIALAERRRGYGDIASSGRAELIAFIGEEEERAVFSVVELWDPDRSSHRSAEFIAD